jgi:hypothetical protein
MEARSLVLVLVSSLGLFACGGKAAVGEPQSAADPWSGYKGTYATAAEPRVGKAESATTSKKAADPKAKSLPEGEQDAEEAAPAKAASKTSIGGASLSSIGADALADVSKTALKGKVVSSKVTVGSQYEQVQVQLKGVTVQIIRPAAKADASGPAVASPKTRNAGLSKAEAGWYDEEADVLLVVNAGKKPAAQKALGAILSR